LTRPAATRREASSIPGDSQGTGVSGGWQKVRPPSVGLRRLGRGCATATEGKQEGSDVIGDVPWPCARQARRWASARRKTRRTSLLEGGRERLERWRWDRGSRNHDRPAPSIKASPKAETIFPPCSAVSSRSIDRDSAIVLFFRLRAHTFRRFSGVASERAMSGGEAACARFPVEHSWFLNRARRRLWAREWLSPLCKTLAGLRNLATETARDRRPVLRTALERAERVLERDTRLCGYAVRRLFGELTCAVVPPPPAIGAEPRTVA